MATKSQDGSLLEAQRAKTMPPKMYKVLFMLKVHNEGRGVCGVFPRDIAATKVEQVGAFARQYQHPLACIMEENE